MRTTLTLDEDVAARLKEEMRRSGQPFKQVVNEYLRLGLVARRKLKREKKFVVNASPMNEKPGLNFDKISELLDQIEGPWHR